MSSAATRTGAHEPALPALAASGAHLWSRQIKIGAPYHFAAHGADVDREGNAVVVARIGGQLDLTSFGGRLLGGVPGQVFVLKLDGEGNLRWCERIVGADDSQGAGWSLAVDRREGSSYLVGEADHGVYLLKFAASGKYGWTRDIDDMVSLVRDRQPLGLAVDGAGDVLVLGHARADREHPLPCLVLFRFDPTGIVRWHRRFPHTGRVRRPRLVLDASGNAIASGYFQGAITFGRHTVEGSPAWDVYLAKLDRHGEPLWSKRLAGKYASGFGVGVDAAGNVVLGGAFQREIDFGGTPTLRTDGTRALFLASLDPGGRQRMAKRYVGDTHSRFELSLAVDRDGSSLLAGYFEGAIDFGDTVLRSSRETESMFVARLDARGNHTWSRCIEGPRDQSGITVHAAPGRSAVVMGSFSGRLDLGGEPLWNEGKDLDLFIARLAPGVEAR